VDGKNHRVTILYRLSARTFELTGLRIESAGSNGIHGREVLAV